MKPTAALYAVSCFLKNRNDKYRRGFLLAEMQLGLAASALLTMLVGNSLLFMLHTGKKVQTDIQLQESGRYMLGMLEKDIGYESASVALQQDGSAIKCRTTAGRKNFSFYREGHALYKSTSTGNGTGKNPLYLPDCAVTEWRVEKLHEKMLLVTLTLEKEGRQRTFQRLIYCVNGQVEDEV